MLENIKIRDLSLSERLDWIRLSRTPNIGRATLLRMISIFGNAQDAIANVAQYSIRGGRAKPIIVNSIQSAQKELEDCQKIKAKIICFCENSFPKMLRHIPDPPALLTIRGKEKLMHKNIVAIVGPRNASTNGCVFAQKVAFELGQADIIIVSGLARGIDAAAHEASLLGGTIGVIAGGIDNIYPKENRLLYQKVVEQGLLISESPIHSPPKGGNFPQRNRIISGLSIGVAVIEATLRSGTLITSRFALEQNREIFAVPGSPFDPRYEGTNRLIRQGAKLIQSSQDILEDLEEIISSRQRFSPISENDHENDIDNLQFRDADEQIVKEARNIILSHLSYSPTNLDHIIDRLEIPAKIINIVLVQLELADIIETNNNRVILKRSR